MSRTLLSIGPVNIQVFGLMIVLGIIAAFVVISREAKRKGISSSQIVDLLLYTLVGGIAGARLFYVFVYNWSYYSRHPVEIMLVNQGGLSIHGAVIGGVLAGYVFVKLKKISFWDTADLVAPGLILGQAIGRVGCDVFGKPMVGDWFWGITVSGVKLHPAQLYEFVPDFILFYFLWSYRKRTYFSGQLFLIYVVAFAAIRAVVEFFRINPMVWGPFSVAHVTSLVFMVLAGIFWVYLAGKNSTRKRPGAFAGNTGTLLATITLTGIAVAGYYFINTVLL